MRTNPPRPRWRGFSFALHLLRVHGFYFSLRQCSLIQAFTAPFVSPMQVIPPTTQRLHRYQIPPPRRTLYSSAQPPYYNKVYNSTSQTMPTRLGQLLPWADRWQVLHPAHLLRGQPSTLHPSGQSSSGRRGTIDGYRRISFRAFAR